jgi:hypothetical protein
MPVDTPPQQDAVQQLAAAIAASSQDELLQIAQLLLDAEPATLFGATEFKIRDLVLKIGAKAYQQRLAQKKTATSRPR